MPSKQLISRSFQSSRKAGRTVWGLSRVGRDLGQAQEKARMSGLDSATKPTRYARPLASRRKLPLGGTFMGIARSALPIGPRGPEHPCPAQSPPPWRANHSQKLNRIASNRCELAGA